MLIYLTLISGLACTNVLHGMGIIIKRWFEIKVDWVHPLAAVFLLLTIADYWFHSYYYPYSPAYGNIFVFFSFLFPSTMLFFSSVTIFPRWSHKLDNYTKFFERHLRLNTFIYSLFLASVLFKFYVSGLVLSFKVAAPLLVSLLFFMIIDLTNSVKCYKIFIPIIVAINIARWFFQGIVWS